VIQTEPPIGTLFSFDQRRSLRGACRRTYQRHVDKFRTTSAGADASRPTQKSVKADKIANDVVDATFAAYATYFQGLLSKDTKANELYRNAKHVLKGFPVSPDKLRQLVQ
jgi:hypothetical protein